jgi:hypothetical protein
MTSPIKTPPALPSTCPYRSDPILGAKFQVFKPPSKVEPRPVAVTKIY